MAQIHAYNYKPPVKFFGTPYLGTFLGVELELDVIGCDDDDTCPVKLEACQDTEDILGDFVYFKHDGSIEGVEIVSHPASLLVHRRRWKQFFDNAPDSFKVTRYDGLHVHATRDGMTKHQLWEIHSFVNNQLAHTKNVVDQPKALKWLKSLAGRDFNNFARHIIKPECSIGNTDTSSKYESVNCLPARTVEFRLFAATLDFKEFMLRLEFVAALMQAAKQMETSINLDNFVAFVQGHPKRFPVLVPWLAKENVL